MSNSKKALTKKEEKNMNPTNNNAVKKFIAKFENRITFESNANKRPAALNFTPAQIEAFSFERALDQLSDTGQLVVTNNANESRSKGYVVVYDNYVQRPSFARAVALAQSGVYSAVVRAFDQDGQKCDHRAEGAEISRLEVELWDTTLAAQHRMVIWQDTPDGWAVSNTYYAEVVYNNLGRPMRLRPGAPHPARKALEERAVRFNAWATGRNELKTPDEYFISRVNPQACFDKYAILSAFLISTVAFYTWAKTQETFATHVATLVKKGEGAYRAQYYDLSGLEYPGYQVKPATPDAD